MDEQQDELPPPLRTKLQGLVERHQGQPQDTQIKNDKRPVGTISAPENNDAVGTQIPVVATVSNISEGHHAWIMVKRQGLVWPKEPEVPADGGRHEMIAFEGGAPGKLDLILVMVNQEGHAAILKWFEQGNATGNWPGLVPKKLGIVELDVVRDLRFGK